MSGAPALSSASAQVAASIKDELHVERINGADDAAMIWKDMLDNKVSPSRGIIVSLN